MSRLVLAILSSTVLAGCAASGLDAKSKFACSAPDGVTCMSVSGVYANARAGTLPSQQVGGAVQTAEATRASGTAERPASVPPNAAAMNPTPAGAPASPRDMHAPYMGMPVRTAERVLRIWMSPYEDPDGTLFDQSYFYVTVAGGRWQVENNRISPRQAIRQITPLSTDNPANREPSVQLRSPQQQAQSMVQMAPPAVPMQQEPSEGLGGSLPE